MKKTYEKPVLNVEQFDVEDVITVSTLDTVGDTYENPINMGDFSSAPGND